MRGTIGYRVCRMCGERQRGGDEPLFLPASRRRPVAEVVYARGLAQSCLHEAAHWLLAVHGAAAIPFAWHVPP